MDEWESYSGLTFEGSVLDSSHSKSIYRHSTIEHTILKLI